MNRIRTQFCPLVYAIDWIFDDGSTFEVTTTGNNWKALDEALENGFQIILLSTPSVEATTTT